jgi:hypothetical protein
MTPAMPRALKIPLAIPDSTDRTELVAGATFLECSAQEMDRDALIVWLEQHVVETGRMPRPSSVYEPGIGVAALRTRLRDSDAVLVGVIRAARERTLAALTGLLATTPADGFVLAALFATRVRRCTERSGWLACPRPTDALSDIVLSLFAVDVLRFREAYDHRLRVCAHCGRFGLDGTAGSSRTSCAAHPFA